MLKCNLLSFKLKWNTYSLYFFNPYHQPVLCVVKIPLHLLVEPKHTYLSLFLPEIKSCQNLKVFLLAGLNWVGWGEKNYSRWTSCPISQTLHSSMTIFESICRMWLLLQRFYRLLRILKWFRVELRELKLQPFLKQTIHKSFSFSLC